MRGREAMDAKEWMKDKLKKREKWEIKNGESETSEHERKPKMQLPAIKRYNTARGRKAKREIKDRSGK